MYVGKNPFCHASVPPCGARGVTAGKNRVNFAKFTRFFPHVPLCRKRPTAFFDRLGVIQGVTVETSKEQASRSEPSERVSAPPDRVRYIPGWATDSKLTPWPERPTYVLKVWFSA